MPLPDMGRTIKVLFLRDPSADGQKEDIPFTGYKMFLPDGTQGCRGFDAFCKLGTRLIFGKDWRPESHLSQLHLFDVDQDAPPTKLYCERARRFKLVGEDGGIVRMHLRDGRPTEVYFDLNLDHPDVIRWMGGPVGEKGRWVDFIARGVSGDLVQPEIHLGLAAVTFRRNRGFLLGKRKGGHGAGNWGFPGGHPKVGETWEQCCVREAYEETGLVVVPRAYRPPMMRPWGVTENIYRDRHYNTVWMICHAPEGEPQVREPHACEAWNWVEPLNLPFYAEGQDQADNPWIPVKPLWELAAELGLREA